MKQFSLLALIASTVFIFSCGEDNEPILDFSPDDPFDARLNNNTTDSLTATVFLSDIDDNTIDVLLSFTSTETMRRVYVTRNIQGQGFEKVDASTAFGVNDKGDGSIDLNNDLANGFSFDLDFTTAGLPTEGTVVYNFWATSAKGDFRDTSNDLVVGVAELTIDLEGTNPASLLQEYTNVIRLEAPTADGDSETFISTFDGEVYTIDEGEEFAAFWDFGFYYLNSTGVSLASTAAYPNLFRDPNDPEQDGTPTLPLVSVNTFLNIEATEVNNAYFALAPDGTDFDSFSTVDDLTFTITQNDEEDINELEVGDIVYILDQYGKKGVLEVTALLGSFGSDGFVEFDLKMQQ